MNVNNFLNCEQAASVLKDRRSPHHTTPLIKLFISKLLHLFLKAQSLQKLFKLTVTDEGISSLSFIYMVQQDFLTPEHWLSKHFWHSCFLPALNENKMFTAQMFFRFLQKNIQQKCSDIKAAEEHRASTEILFIYVLQQLVYLFGLVRCLKYAFKTPQMV